MYLIDPVVDSLLFLIWLMVHFVLQVLEVIRSNYDTLTLKLQENLDHYEKYSEKPKEAAFFTQLVNTIQRYVLSVAISE